MNNNMKEKRSFTLKCWDSMQFTLMQNEETKLYTIKAKENWVMHSMCYYASNSSKKLGNLQESILGYSIPSEDSHFPYCKTEEDAILLLEELAKERFLRDKGYSGESFIEITERLLSNSLQSALHEIGSVTAYKLLRINRNKRCGKDDTKNITVIRSGEMTFSPKGKETISTNEYEWSKKNRQSSKYGRLLLRVFKENDVEVTPQEIEVISNKLRAKYNPDVKFSIVEGRDITHWYHEDQYCTSSNIGTLESSCMKYDHCQDYFEIYEDHAKMLIAVNENTDLLLGRALIWEVDGKTYLDRIYGSDIIIEKFKQYAKENKWYYKSEQSYNNKTDWINPDGEEEEIILTVDISGNDYDYYPYMDTLTYYRDGQYITNSCRNYDHELTDTDGNRDTNGVYCEYSDSYSHPDDVVYIDDGNYSGNADVNDAEYCYETDEWHLEEDMITTEGGTRVFRDADGVIEGDDGLYYYGDEAAPCEYHGGWFSSSEIHWNEDLSMNIHEDYLEDAYEEHGWVKDEDGNWVEESELETETIKS